MLLEKELARKAPIKTSSNWKGNYLNMDKKDKNPINKDADALDCYTEYIPIGTTHEWQQPAWLAC